eukprot:6169917-Heterocapsa_arctica.AAC.1
MAPSSATPGPLLAPAWLSSMSAEELLPEFELDEEDDGAGEKSDGEVGGDDERDPVSTAGSSKGRGRGRGRGQADGGRGGRGGRKGDKNSKFCNGCNKYHLRSDFPAGKAMCG